MGVKLSRASGGAWVSTDQKPLRRLKELFDIKRNSSRFHTPLESFDPSFNASSREDTNIRPHQGVSSPHFSINRRRGTVEAGEKVGYRRQQTYRTEKEKPLSSAPSSTIPTISKHDDKEEKKRYNKSLPSIPSLDELPPIVPLKITKKPFTPQSGATIGPSRTTHANTLDPSFNAELNPTAQDVPITNGECNTSSLPFVTRRYAQINHHQSTSAVEEDCLQSQLSTTDTPFLRHTITRDTTVDVLLQIELLINELGGPNDSSPSVRR